MQILCNFEYFYNNRINIHQLVFIIKPANSGILTNVIVKFRSNFLIVSFQYLNYNFSSFFSVPNSIPIYRCKF